MTRLFIAEKSSVAKAIAAVLGNAKSCGEYIQCGDDLVAHCVGHILEMAMPEDYDPKYKTWDAGDLPIVPKTWKMLPKAQFRKKLATMRELIGRADTIVNAGDIDNEGQLLVDEVLEYLGNKKPVLRYWASAPDAVSIRRALADLKPNTNYRGMRDAAEARGRVDWLIGMNLTRAYTLRARRGGNDGVKTVGRVQTPTLGLVVARDREITNFKPVAFHTLAATIEHANGAFRAGWKPKEDQAGLNADGRLTDTAIANAIVKAVAGQAVHIAEFTKKPETENHPRTWSLGGLTLVASNKWGYTAEQVLECCQNLYEKHTLTSYPRSDCDYLPESQWADAPAVLAAIKASSPDFEKLVDGADLKIKSRTWNDAKITAHHGIIPTMHHGRAKGLREDERNIYDLIVRAYLAQFYPVHEYLRTAIEVAVAGERFVATGRITTRNGWKDVFQAEEESKPEDVGEAQAIPPMTAGDPAKCIKVERKDQKTKAPKPYTEGTLIDAMTHVHKYISDLEEKKLLKEGEGIGTEATRAAILGELKRRKFLITDGKKIVSTESGQALIDALPAQLTSASLTTVFQRGLKAIEQGKATGAQFLAEQATFVAQRVAAANDGAMAPVGGTGMSYSCPYCGKPLAKRKGPHRAFWSCTGWKRDDSKSCKATFPDDKGKPQGLQPKGNP